MFEGVFMGSLGCVCVFVCVPVCVFRSRNERSLPYRGAEIRSVKGLSVVGSCLHGTCFLLSQNDVMSVFFVCECVCVFPTDLRAWRGGEGDRYVGWSGDG